MRACIRIAETISGKCFINQLTQLQTPGIFRQMFQRSKVGLAGFEPAASSSRTKRATKLRYSPMSIVLIKKQCLRLLAPHTFRRFALSCAVRFRIFVRHALSHFAHVTHFVRLATLRQLGYTSVNFLQISNVCRFQASLSNFRKILKNFIKKFACTILRLKSPCARSEHSAIFAKLPHFS